MENIWVMLALLSAFSLATSDALAKKSLETSNEYLVAWFRLFFTLPLLLVLLFFIPVPQLDRKFYLAYFIALPVELITIILYVKALKISPMSLSLPFLALTPAVLILVAYFILGEKVSPRGAAGILLIASGSYVLNVSETQKGIWKPFSAIIREKGALMMIGVAVLYSITSSMGKMAIEHSSPLFFGITYFIGLTICFTPIALWMGRRELRSLRHSGHYKPLVLSGPFYALMIITHMTAMDLTKVAYMVSVKRTSLLFGVLYGYLVFREEKIRERALGALIMFSGFVLVVLSA